MEVSDLISGYAAIVATALAVFEIWKHFQSDPVLLVRQIIRKEEEGFRHLDFELVNIGNLPFYIDFTGVCVAYRKLSSPWKMHYTYSRSLRSTRFVYVNKHRMGGPLDPGETLSAYFNIEDQTEIHSLLKNQRLLGKTMLLFVSHSLSAKPYKLYLR